MVARTLFAGAALPAGWTTYTPTAGDTAQLDPTGLGLALEGGSAHGISPWTGVEALSGYLRAQVDLPAGDFDLAVVFSRPHGPLCQGELFLNIPSMSGVYVAPSAASLAKVWLGTYPYGNPGGADYYLVAAFATDVTGGPTSGPGIRWIENRGARNGGDRLDRLLYRVKRTGTVLHLYRAFGAKDDGTAGFKWAGNSLQEDTSFDDPCGGGAGVLALVCGGLQAWTFRGVLPLVAGVLAAPAAPTGGAAASAPLGGAYGVGFRWDASPADVARTLEVETATDAGFTTSVRRVLLDPLPDGVAPGLHRAAALAVTVYARARWVDELNQASAWSATVSAAAAAPPVTSPSYAAPVQAVRAGEAVRIVRSPA